MAAGAEGDQVLLSVVSEAAPRVDVVDLEIGRAATILAAPAVAL